MAPTREREADVLLRLPYRVSIANSMFETPRFWWGIMEKALRRDVKAFFAGVEFPFDRYPDEAETLRYLIFGYRKVGEFNRYLEMVFREFVDLVRELEGLEPITPKRAIEIIDAPLTEGEIASRLATAIKAQRYEEAAYYRDRLADIEERKKRARR